MTWFEWGLTINDNLTTRLTSQVVTIAIVLAVICFICTLAYNYFKNGVATFLGDENKFPDYMDIARCLCLVFCITLYIPIAKALVGTMDVVNQASSMDSSYSGQFQSLADEFLNMQEVDQQDRMNQALEEEMRGGEYSQYAAAEMDKQESETENGSEAGSGGFWAAMNPANWVSIAISAISKIMYSIVKLVILGITSIVIKVLVIVGPLAFAFSILPVFGKQLEQWFGTLLNAGMVFTTINILDLIQVNILEHVVNDKQSLLESANTMVATLIINTILIFVYCSVFWLTGKFVGKGDAGRIISKIVGTATAVIGGAIGGGAVAAKLASNEAGGNSSGGGGGSSGGSGGSSGGGK